MEFKPTPLPGVTLIEPRVYGDERGFFLESWNARTFANAGLNFSFVQDNHSRSSRGVLRGLHYQIDRVQGKLVRVTRGRVFDVAVDLRRDSPTLGQWYGVELSEENQRMLWLPPGFAHGFYVVSEIAELLYKCTDYYHPASEVVLRWDDPDLAIEWPLLSPQPLLSARDATGIAFREAPRL